jgi:hypothetical protein
MVRKNLVGWIVLATAVTGTAEARRPAPADSRRVPLRLAAGRLLIVPVTVDGSGPYPFLLDTGATRSLVDEALAGSASLAAGGGDRA